MDSFFNIESETNSIFELTSELTPILPTNLLIDLLTDFEQAFNNSANLTDFNNESFKLNDDKSLIYIIKEGLFTCTLLPIKLNKPREVIVQCTM